MCVWPARCYIVSSQYEGTYFNQNYLFIYLFMNYGESCDIKLLFSTPRASRVVFFKF